MAPITTTTAGITRQIIDDPNLISLLKRLHAFHIPECYLNAPFPPPSREENDVAMDCCDSKDEMEEMIDGLIGELEGHCRWRFQEQADLYEWIKPLNLIDATIRYFIESHPSLLLIPPQHPILSEGADSNQPSTSVDASSSSPSSCSEENTPPPKVTTQLITLLTFLSTLLRNSINKSLFHSVHELSALLTSQNDTLSHLALTCLCTLSQPPLLHRQQAPEMGGHSTQLNVLTDGGRIMRRILQCAVGWGSKGSNLGLLNCVELQDVDLDNVKEESCVGCVCFETCVEVGGRNSLVNVEVDWEDMYFKKQEKEKGGQRVEQQDEPTEKRRKVVLSSSTNAESAVSMAQPHLKSTAQIFHECLSSIHQQLNNNNNNTSSIHTLPPEKQFTLLSQIRLARSFHTQSTRILATEYRLRAIICLLSAQPNQDTIGTFFEAQPELCGEMVDLVRPTVSGGNLAGTSGQENGHNDSLLALSNSPQVPFHIRTLAIEALTALVARRDSTGMSNNVARQVNVLAELGVGKGLYSGLLPALIRYSLAALNSFLLTDTNNNGRGSAERSGEKEKELDLGQELGMIFLQCTKGPELPQKEREEKALEFIDSVLTLTSAVISVPSGTAALTDCGIIPALVSTIALDSQIAQKRTVSGNVDSSPFVAGDDGNNESYSECLLKYITAQAIQILEGAIVTHGSALSAFHELKGVDILVQRLNIEMERVKQVKSNKDDDDVAFKDGDDNHQRSLTAARRVLLFSAVNCLTVVFHQQESSGSNAAIPSGAAQLCKPELMGVLMDLLDNTDAFGGVLAGLVSTLLSDVINADPQVVHHVHDSGLAKAFLSLLLGKNNEMKQIIGSDVEKWGQVDMEASAELVMAFPNLILALSLTESGAKSIADLDPFPALLSVFCSPKFAMPNSRCLLNEMAAIVGTGLDEIMRHNPTNLRPLVVKAIVQVMNRVVYIGKQLTLKEEHNTECNDDADLITERTYLVQYSHNIAQMLEQILHKEDHVPLFINEGGVDALLELVRWSITPAGKKFVAHVTCLSSPSIGSVTHTNISTSFGSIVRTIASHSESNKITKKIMDALETQFTDLRKCIARFRDGVATGTAVMGAENEGEFSFSNILHSIPAVPLYDMESSDQNTVFLDSLASLFRSVIAVDWLVQSLSTTLRAANQRVSDMGIGAMMFGRNEKELQKELSSESFKYIMYQLCILQRSALWEVCRVRTEPGFDQRDLARSESPNDLPLVYRIRIVCQEGAICRNGIDIDGCDNIGNVEMGEIIEAYDRCINSCGVLRYKTSRGWVSELTRGHGRENIAEIIDVKKGSGPLVNFNATQAQRNLKRVECGVPDLCTVSASILARLHSSHSELFSTFEKIMLSRLRVRDSLSSATFSPYMSSIATIMSKNLQDDFKFVDDIDESTSEDGIMPNLSHDAAKCMYLGNTLNLFHTSLYSEKRIERRGSMNILLLLRVLTSEGWREGIYPPEKEPEEDKEYAFISAIRFVLKHSLRDMAIFAVKKKASREEEQPVVADRSKSSHQRLSRAVASSLPPTISLLQRLISRQNIVDSPISMSIGKMKVAHLKTLVTDEASKLSKLTPSFNPNQFARGLHMRLAKLSFEIFSDQRLCCAPAHVLHPWISYMNTMLTSLQDAAKCTPVVSLSLSGSNHSRTRSGASSGPRGFMNDVLGMLNAEQLQGLDAEQIESLYSSRADGMPARLRQQLSERFEPSEESIERLIEMGFARDHAVESLESVGSNRIDVAMEYALSHPPSSPATLERRRAAREERRRRHEQLVAAVSSRNGSASNSQDETTTAPNEQNESANAAAEASKSDSNDVQKDEEEANAKPKALSKEELKAIKDKEFEEKDAARAKDFLDSIKEDISSICLNIIESGSAAEKFQSEMESVGNLDDGSGAIDTDAENVTVVVASFLVDLCARFSDDTSKISSALIRRLKSNLRIKSRSHCQVKQGCEVNFGALAHASVIFFRSVPKSRTFILKHGVVSCLLHCVRNVTLASSLRNGANGDSSWPCWLAPSLLLLDLMAQPATISLEEEKDGDNETSGAKAGKKGEFSKVMAEHKKQTAALAKHTKHVFTVLNRDANSSATKKKRGKSSDATNHQEQQDANQNESSKDNPNKKEAQQSLSIPTLPTLLPLLHSSDAEASMRLCLQLLGLRSARKILDADQLEKVCPPPNIVHAILSLLVRVLHSSKIASLCLQMGGADAILSLPGSCHFTGSSALVTLALRRMLEDDATLQGMMETEIRSQVTKIFKKQHRGSSNQQPRATMRPFMLAITPLLHRAPLISIRAIACSVRLEPKGDQGSSLSSSRDARVVLLTSEERARNSKLLSPHGVSKDNGVQAETFSKKTPTKSHDDQAHHRTRGQSKSPHQSKKDKSDPKKQSMHEKSSPQNHVISLLLSKVLQTSIEDAQAHSQRPFLMLYDFLDILSDLILAIPSCGAAIHRYKPPPTFSINHAISGCRNPPQTAVSYLIHKLVTLPRLKTPSTHDKSEDETPEKKLAIMKAKTSQASARLIVSLVARSGEGRRRVISDLIFAISCGRINNQQLMSLLAAARNAVPSVDEDFEMSAIQTWTELVMGLSAPRSKLSAASTDPNSSLSYEVIRVMLEQGAPHAITFAMEKINLSRPSAGTVAGSLLRPLEIFTRGTVYSKVVDMVKADNNKKTSDAGESKESRRMTFGPSNRSESAFADDEMIEEGFDGVNNSQRAPEDIENDIVVGGDIDMEDDFEEDDENSDSDETEDEVRLGNVDFSDEDEEGFDDAESNSSDIDDEDSAESESNSEDDSEEESESSNDGDSDMQDEEMGEEEDEEMFLDGTEQDVDAINEEGWSRSVGRRFEEEGDENEFDGDDVHVGGHEIEDEMGDWTAVDGGEVGGGPLVGDIPGGFANILMDALSRSGVPRGLGRIGVGGQGLAVVENMLGNLLREGRVQELEDIGIRVVRNGGGEPGRTGLGLRFPLGSGRATNADEGRDDATTNNSIVPVHQTVAPEGSYGAPSLSNRSSLAETSPMEYIYGGPAAGSEYYYRGSGPSDNPQESARLNTDTSELFPGGLAASTVSSRSGRITTHPLLTSLHLPPVNALHTQSARADRQGSANESGYRIQSMSSTVIRTQSGAMRVNRGQIDPLTGGPIPSGHALSFGWIDDALPPENGTDEFGNLFGQALIDANQTIVDSLAARNEAAVEEEINAQTNELTDNSNADADHAEMETAPDETAAPEVSTASGDNVDVSRLTISQQETDSHPTIPASTDQHESDDQSDADEDDTEMADAEETANHDAQVDVDAPIDVDSSHPDEQEHSQEAAGDAEEQDVATEEQVADGDSADGRDNNVENPTEVAEGAQEGELTCPPDVDADVFNSLPLEMQQEICREHAEATNGIAAQIEGLGGLDPEALAALPEEMRQEIIEQERQQQQRRQQESEAAPADPSNAEDMDNANFLASLAPDLRQEILLTADQAFLESLPPQIRAEANILRERVAAQHRNRVETQARPNAANASNPTASRAETHGARRRQRTGKIRVETDRSHLVYTPETMAGFGPLLTGTSIKSVFRLFYLLDPIQKHQRTFQKLLLNMCRHPSSRNACIDLFATLLNSDKAGVLKVLAMADENSVFITANDDFPPSKLIGSAPDSADDSSNARSMGGLAPRNYAVSAATAATSLPASFRGPSSHIPPIIARRMITVLANLAKSSPRVCVSMIENDPGSLSCLDRCLDLLKMSLYARSAKNLEQLLTLLETLVVPFSLLPKADVEVDLTHDRAASGMEYVKVPRVAVSKERLHLLISALRLECCNDTSFNKVNVISRRLSRVDANRDCIVGELASVAQGLGAAAIRDLKSAGVRLGAATHLQKHSLDLESTKCNEAISSETKDLVTGAPSNAVSLSTSNSELKFLRVLQTLQSLCNEFDENVASESNSPEFTMLVQSLDLEPLWKELETCLHLVSVLEGVTKQGDMDESTEEEQGEGDVEGDDPMRERSGKKLQNSVAGLISRFLPAIEAFFIVNENSAVEEDAQPEGHDNRLVQFASSNKVLLNALLRSNPQLLEKGLKSLVQPKCRPFLDFDVKRQWFKTQVRRLRQQASRRHGSLRLNLRRKHVFEDSFRAFIHRNAEELRGRLHITFQNEEGVDAGGLSREFFAILAKEMFNPNYALFMSTEDGCTFQPNPNSSINLDDLNYFRFVGRIVGKAVTDGYLLDAHFTRSLYKHMIGIKPTHHDMQAIDPDYYKNLQLILEHNLEDIGVELTFSTEDHSFGRSQVIDLIPNGRNIAVTDETKAKYVDLVCQHRMTTAIEKQIKAYLEGFHEMVDKDMISIFTAKELELLISGMPDIDIHDLKKNTDYNGYRPADKEIGWFWNIMFNLSRSEKAAFLQFVTGSSKVPLAGFSELQGMRGVQKFSINKASGSAGALISAHTCFNALDLPVYKSEEEMKEKLLYAISEGGGAFLFA